MSTIKTAASILFLLGLGIFMLTKFPATNQMIQEIAHWGTQREQEIPIAKRLIRDIENYTNQQQAKFSTTDDEARMIPNPAQRHPNLKRLMLRLTNERRASAGAPPVRLGQNPAAQIHAEEALKGCYSAHWDRWGMKPNHRYTLTGGTGADAENVSGMDYCIRPGQNYSPNGPMETEVAETVQGWMDSPGHRKTLLDPVHTIMNAGIAYDRFNINMVQHFCKRRS